MNVAAESKECNGFCSFNHGIILYTDLGFSLHVIIFFGNTEFSFFSHQGFHMGISIVILYQIFYGTFA